jgi:outer membrane protein assembly factor BamB
MGNKACRRSRCAPASGTASALLLFAASSASFAASLPPPREPDGFPKKWTEITVSRKATWDETLSASYNEQNWLQTIGGSEDLQQAADVIVRLRRIALLEAMVGHFPDQAQKRAEACRTISDLYLGLGDRTRAVQWLKRLADDMPGNTGVADEAYAGILRCADPYTSLPNGRAWVEYAAGGIIALEKSDAAALAKKRLLGLQLQEGDYEAELRMLHRLAAADGKATWWADEVALLSAAGHLAAAADLCEAEGKTQEARAFRARTQAIDLREIGKSPPRSLEMRLRALQSKERAGDPALGDAELVQETIKACADAGALWNEDASHRAQCWLTVDRMLRGLKPAALDPLRELQERSGGPFVQELMPASDESEIDRLFTRYPWSASVHARMIAFAETALREGRWDEALRAFHDVAAHSADTDLIASVYVGSWLAIAEGRGSHEALDAAMRAVPDDAALPWKGELVPAEDVKQAIRGLLPHGLGDLGSFANLRRQKLRLPYVLASDHPLPHGNSPVPRHLGPWPVSRIEPAGESIFIMGPRRVACYNRNTMALRWEQLSDPTLDMPTRVRASADAGAFALRTVAIGSIRSSAVTIRSDSAQSPAAVYGLFFHSSVQGTLYEVTALDAQTGKPLWRTRERPEWNELEPLSEPVAAAGAVYVVATGAGDGADCPASLMCMDAETGATRWKTALGRLPAGGDLRKLARFGAGVTVNGRAVYVSTSLGLLACCDARDGTVEWVRAYPSALQTGRRANQCRREGAAPLVVGNRLFVAPRDHSGVIALDSDTGNTLWESILSPSDHIVGMVGATLVIRAGAELAGLDAASGQDLWTKSVGPSTGAPDQLAGTNVFVLSRSNLRRLDAATGQDLEEVPLSPPPGTEYALLPDGTLLDVCVEQNPLPAAAMAGTCGPPRVPLTNDWSLPCAYPLLVLPAAGQGPTNTFGVLSGRSFSCVKTQPRCELVWRAILGDGADSIGFHGRLVIAARGRKLTALDAMDGALRWSLTLPFDPQVVGGDERAVFAGDLTLQGRIAAVDPETGRILWLRWFGEEPRFGKGPLGWIAMDRDPAGASALKLYWKAALFGKEGWRQAVADVDALSGTIQDVQPFMPDEPQWPAYMFFGDSRTYVRNQRFLYGASRAGFHREAVACIGRDSQVRFFSLGQASDLAPGWKRSVGPEVERRVGALGFYTTSAGVYLKQLERLFAFEAATGREVVYDLSSATTTTARIIMNVQETGDALTVISGGRPPPPGIDSRLYTHGGLKDDTSVGDVTIQFIKGGVTAQQVVGVRGIPEAGTSPVATLLDGQAKEHYVRQWISMSGINSLGWTRYDVFLYGAVGSVTINGKDKQACSGWDLGNPTHRTTFIQGVNYFKFEGVAGDAFTLDFMDDSYFSALQIVDASNGSAPGRKAASLGISWNGGPGGLGPNDRVGAEVAGGYWYVIGSDQERGPYSKTYITGGYQDPVVRADVFDRATGAIRQTQELPVAPFDLVPFFSDRQAAILDDAVVMADTLGVHVLRSSPPPPPPQ